jgi:hypothetical protein
MSDEPAAGTPAQGAHAVEATAHAEAIADHDQHADPGPDVEGAEHSADSHDAHDAHGGHGGVALGPIDWRAYGAGVLGAALGLVVAAVLAVTTGYVVL